MKFSIFQVQKSIECYFCLLVNVKMPTIGLAELSMKLLLWPWGLYALRPIFAFRG